MGHRIKVEYDLALFTMEGPETLGKSIMQIRPLSERCSVLEWINYRDVRMRGTVRIIYSDYLSLSILGITRKLCKCL